MISRTCLASCHACAIRSRRLGPMPSTVCSSAARFSITARTSAPNRPTSFFARIGPMPFHQAAAEVPLDPLGCGRRHGLHACRLELQPVFLVPDPPALRAQPFPCGHGRQRPDDRCLIPLPSCFHAQDAEAAFVVVESDALDHTGDFLGRGSAFRDCGSHAWGSFSHGRSALGEPFGKAILPGFGCWEGSGRLSRSRGAGSLCDQPSGQSERGLCSRQAPFGSNQPSSLGAPTK